jgi:protein-disulfide isomerase
MVIYCGFFFDVFNSKNGDFMKFNRILIASALISGVMMGATATFAASNDVSPAQKAQIEGVVHTYLMQNPEVIIEAVKSLQQKEYDKMQQKSKQMAGKEAGSLFNQTADPVVGNPNGKVTLVEFFDYQCPHCVDMVPVLSALVKANPDLRIVYKEFPIRGASSQLAAKAALAANMQGKYLVLHDALMKASPNITEAKVFELAKSLGLDVVKLKADMSSAAVDQQIKANYKLAQDLQLVGTPAFFIAKTNNNGSSDAIEFIPGQVDQQYLQTSIQKAAH